MTLQSRATLAGFRSVRRIAGVRVTLSRGAATGVVLAVPGDTIIETTNEDGQVVRVKVRDYLILREDYREIIGGDPRRGDQITEEVAGFIRTFEAAELNGEIFRWWDKDGQVFRVHTVEGCSETTTTEEGTTTTAGE